MTTSLEVTFGLGSQVSLTVGLGKTGTFGHWIGETAAGSVILIFMANMLTPVAFAAFVAITGRYDLAFLVCGAFSLVCLPLLYGMGPKSELKREPRGR